MLLFVLSYTGEREESPSGLPLWRSEQIRGGPEDHAQGSAGTGTVT